MLLLGLSLQAQAEMQNRQVDVGDGETMELRVFPAPASRDILLWLPCDQGLGVAEVGMAERLADAGQEVWLTDLLGMHFLDTNPASIRSITGDEVLDVIDHISTGDGRPVYLVAAGHCALPALRAAMLHADRHRGGAREDAIAGIMLVYPELQDGTPQPGEGLDYDLEVAAVDRPVAVLQPELAPGRFWLDDLRQSLESGGAQVITLLLPRVRNYFYINSNPNASEQRLARDMPELLLATKQTLATKFGCTNRMLSHAGGGY